MKRGNENKPHIAILGCCNAGKSTLLNFLSGDNASIVSEVMGTTTDPVRRSVEILDFAPVVFIDTAGVDDESELGKERKAKSLEVLYSVDMAIVVYRGEWGEMQDSIVKSLDKQAIPYIKVLNNDVDNQYSISYNEVSINLIGATEEQRSDVMNLIKTTLPSYSYVVPSIFENRVECGEVVVLVCPIDSEAPAGRLILPQVQAIRDLLDKNAVAIVVQFPQLDSVLSMLPNVKLVVTDSQIIDEVRGIVGDDTSLTTFSILLAAVKGDMKLYKEGLLKVDSLKDGDRILILESCLHQTSCDDIGRVKIPRWLQEYSGKSLQFDVVSKLSALPSDLSSYSLAVQCGGCMVTRRQLQGRIHRVANEGVPITNYGMLISKIRV